jgi:hypothetical protein
MTPERLAELRAQRDDLARVAALTVTRAADARRLGERYAAERLTYAEIIELLARRAPCGGPFWRELAGEAIERIAPGLRLTTGAEIAAFIEGVGDVAAVL